MSYCMLGLLAMYYIGDRSGTMQLQSNLAVGFDFGNSQKSTQGQSVVIKEQNDRLE